MKKLLRVLPSTMSVGIICRKFKNINLTIPRDRSQTQIDVIFEVSQLKTKERKDTLKELIATKYIANE